MSTSDGIYVKVAAKVLSICDSPEFMRNGRVTDKGLTELRSRFPGVDFCPLEHDRRFSSVVHWLTVELVTSYITRMLDR
jgi:hypothetical protein